MSSKCFEQKLVSQVSCLRSQTVEGTVLPKTWCLLPETAARRAGWVPLGFSSGGSGGSPLCD